MSQAETMENKRGQTAFGLSYGMIFGIMLIVALLAVAFYAITYFLGMNNCLQTGTFFSDLQDEIDRAWTSGKHAGTFVGTLPESEVTNVCFGTLDTIQASSQDLIIQDELKNNVPPANMNIFMFPPDESCDGDLYYLELKHVKIAKFFCVPVQNGKVQIRLNKGSKESLVTVTGSES